jgi:hypothetical protein|tara:strand:- start:4880 stop:5530 length:651 start_codon:yes stop_codon:yes gene_type:complete
MTEEPEKGASGNDKPAGGDGGSPDNKDAPQLEVKDGAYFVDGKKVVPESDLIGAKKGLEGRLEEQQTTHADAINRSRQVLDEAQTNLASANARVQELESAQKGAVSTEDIARIEKERDDANTARDGVNTQLLNLKRQVIATTYGVPPAQLENKTLEELNSFEEAAKAIASTRGGAGNYALGGGGGDGAPATPMDRAKEIINSTPQRGVRNLPSEQK